MLFADTDFANGASILAVVGTGLTAFFVWLGNRDKLNNDTDRNNLKKDVERLTKENQEQQTAMNGLVNEIDQQKAERAAETKRCDENREKDRAEHKADMDRLWACLVAKLPPVQS